MKPVINIKRIYEPSAKDDGYRVLVDRIWPRGISKEEADLDEWQKEIAPSTALRKWFNHDPVRWEAFKTKYTEELNKNEAAAPFLSQCRRHKTITLLYGAKEERYNQAVVLREYINKELKS
ncbi:DUF488 domain-containing protein [Niabella hirudinis]|uniref:DUF488 domain-containing protein n=1 Tax=Niabella hirudinis TaxID=1285929 RepID=UPI003EB8B69B